MSQSVVLCEGYHDRAFWKGWLGFLGCDDPGGSAAVYDPWGLKVNGGQYAFYSKASQFIRVQACGGRSNVLPAARARVKERDTRPLRRLVLNVDSDADASAESSGEGELTAHTVLNKVLKIDDKAKMTDDHQITLSDGAIINLLHWKADDKQMDALSDKQTLERVVCASLIAAYPDRAPAVVKWLKSRPDPPSADPKEHAWSYMAGWYAQYGCDAFFGAMWKDEAIAEQLKSRLESSGAWTIAEALANE